MQLYKILYFIGLINTKHLLLNNSSIHSYTEPPTPVFSTVRYELRPTLFGTYLNMDSEGSLLRFVLQLKNGLNLIILHFSTEGDPKSNYTCYVSSNGFVSPVGFHFQPIQICLV